MAEGDGEEQVTGAHSGPPDVFISYASQDMAIANAVVTALESHGLKCWIAPRDVTPGAFYADEIVHAIDAAKVIALILSQNAAASPHVVREVERAVSKRHPVISLRIDRAALPAGLEYFLSTSQWLDASDGEPSRAFPRLVEAVRKVLTGAPAPQAADHIPVAPSPRPAPEASRPRRVIAILAALVVAALVAFAVNKLWLSKHAEDSEHRKAATPGATAMPVTPPTVAEPAFAPPPHSIAVMPFANMSGDAKQEYFSDGVSEELLNALSRLNELQVAARTSSFSFKGQNVDVSTIAHKLNVGTVLEGSVRRAGRTVRITVQLVNAVSGFHLWSQTYDRDLKDILAVQTEVATAVAQQLQVELLGDVAARIEVGGTHNPQAYDAYLRGQQLISMGESEADFRAALAAFDQAIALDRNYGAAHAQRARALIGISITTSDSGIRDAVRRQARAAAERAVALAPELAEAHVELWRVRLVGFLDLTGAATEIERALALAPGSAYVQRNFGAFAGDLGHHEVALAAVRRAVRLDPQNFRYRVHLATSLYDARRFSEALIAIEDAKALKPESHEVGAFVALNYLALGQSERAQQMCQSPAGLEEDFRARCLALAYRKLGKLKDAESELDKFRALGGDSAAYEYAQIYAQWGERVSAVRWLVMAERLRDPELLDLRADWMLDPIRNEPEFKALEARMNFPP